MATVPVDGALGTTLQARGLPSGVPADTWVLERPGQVAAVHRAFVAAGARVLRTATLCSRTDRALLDTAVTLARSAEPDEVWLSLGPVGPDADPHLGLVHALDTGAERVLLETFIDPGELVAAATWLTARGVRVVASLVPGPRGLWHEAPYPVRALRRAGVEVLGLNCGRDPRHAVEAWRTFHDEGPWFVAPAWGDGFSQAWSGLAGKVAFLGGCCGVDPERWEASWPA